MATDILILLLAVLAASALSRLLRHGSRNGHDRFKPPAPAE